MRKSNAKRVLLFFGIAVVALAAITCLLFETALFHVNPIKLGFTRTDFGKFFVFSKSELVESDFAGVEAAMARNEATHGMRYNAKVQIILCDHQSEINRYLPFASAANRRNAAPFPPWPNTIYISPKAKERYGTLGPTLAHELSHILLMQNYGNARIWYLEQTQEWIVEGYATYLAGWPDYFPREQLVERATAAGINLSCGRLLGAKRLGSIPLPLRYMVYRYFVDYLFQRNSAAAIHFLKSVCRRPWTVEIAFKDHFGTSLTESVEAFWADLKTNDMASRLTGVFDQAGGGRQMPSGWYGFSLGLGSF
jgi:hypothetical protein